MLESVLTARHLGLILTQCGYLTSCTHYIRVMERYTETLHVKKMADFVVEYITLLTFELGSFRANGF